MITFIILTFISGIISCVCFDETCCNSGYLSRRNTKRNARKKWKSDQQKNDKLKNEMRTKKIEMTNRNEATI